MMTRLIRAAQRAMFAYLAIDRHVSCTATRFVVHYNYVAEHDRGRNASRMDRYYPRQVKYEN